MCMPKAEGTAAVTSVLFAHHQQVSSKKVSVQKMPARVKVGWASVTTVTTDDHLKVQLRNLFIFIMVSVQ